MYVFHVREKPSAMPKSSRLTLECGSTPVCQQDRLLALQNIDERLQRYRLVQPKLERQMTQSLKDYGQVSPIIVCELEGQTVLVDGFKRLHAARSLKRFTHLNARTLEVDLLTASSTTEQTNFVLAKSREALRQSQTEYVHHWDPRMSVNGNRVAKRLGMLLDCLAKMNSWLRYTGRAELQAIDREPLTSGFVKLAQETTLVHEATADFLKESKLP